MKKAISGICSIVPIITLILSFLLMFLSMLTESTTETLFMLFMILALGMACIVVTICWVDIVWFIVMAIKNPQLETGMKVVWSVLLYMGNIFVFPVYWWMYLRNE